VIVAEALRFPGVMKGRPIEPEEFHRIVLAVPSVVGETATPSWIHYLRGLWWSGLRLSESLELWWNRDDRLCVVLPGEHPMLRIPAAMEKGNRERVLAIAPEFAEFLLATPEIERAGRLFNPKPKRMHAGRLSADWVSRLVDRADAARVDRNHPKVLRRPKCQEHGSHFVGSLRKSPR
jgi:hypothetical protein